MLRRRELLAASVLPGWVRRCGPDCAEAWNTHLADSVQLTVRGD